MAIDGHILRKLLWVKLKNKNKKTPEKYLNLSIGSTKGILENQSQKYILGHKSISDPTFLIAYRRFVGRAVRLPLRSDSKARLGCQLGRRTTSMTRKWGENSKAEEIKVSCRSEPRSTCAP